MRLLFLLLFISLRAEAYIQTAVKVRKVYPDGSSEVLVTVYRYGLDSLGHQGFFDLHGHSEAVPDTFVQRLTRALERIENGGPEGRALLAYLDSVPRRTLVAYSHANEADVEGGQYVRWDPEDTLGAPELGGGIYRPAFIGLAHELAHIRDVWQGTVNRSTWRNLPAGDGQWIQVSCAELYATHVENKIRAENGLPLRLS